MELNMSFTIDDNTTRESIVIAILEAALVAADHVKEHGAPEVDDQVALSVTSTPGLLDETILFRSE